MALQTNWLGMQMNLSRTPVSATQNNRGKTFGIVACGRPASGVNAAIASAVREIYQSGNSAVGFVDGMKGIVRGDAIELPPYLVSGISSRGGISIGTSSFNMKDSTRQLKEKLEQYGISGLLAICGTETGATMARLAESGFPVVTIPKSIHNNLPGTKMSIGFRTAANAASNQLRALKESARSVNGTNLFVAEFGGLFSSSLALSSGNSSESTAIFIPEEYTLEGIRAIVSHAFPNKDYILDRIARTVTVRGEILNTANFLRLIEDDKTREEDLVLDFSFIANEIARIMASRRKANISYGVFPVSQGIARKLMFDPYTFSAKDAKPESFQVLGLEQPFFVKADVYGKPRFTDVPSGESLVNLTRTALHGYNIPSRVSLFSLNDGLDTLEPVSGDIELAKAFGYRAAELLLSGQTGRMVTIDPTGVIGSIAHKEMPFDYRGSFLPRPIDLGDAIYEESISSQRWKSSPALDVSPHIEE